MLNNMKEEFLAINGNEQFNFIIKKYPRQIANYAKNTKKIRRLAMNNIKLIVVMREWKIFCNIM